MLHAFSVLFIELGMVYIKRLSVSCLSSSRVRGQCVGSTVSRSLVFIHPISEVLIGLSSDDAPKIKKKKKHTKKRVFLVIYYFFKVFLYPNYTFRAISKNLHELLQTK